MKNTIYGVIGHKGKLGSLLIQRPNFFPIYCDILDKKSIEAGLGWNEKRNPIDIIVNLAAVSNVEFGENNVHQMFEVNCRGISNIHEVFGKRVVTISTNHVYSGSHWLLNPTEKTKPNPVNSYGVSKQIAESLALGAGGKVIRLSRTLSKHDDDFAGYVYGRYGVPTFMKRNYLTRMQAVLGIEYFATHFDSMPSVLNYGSIKGYSIYDILKLYVEKRGMTNNLQKRNYEIPFYASRPLNGTMNVNLSQKYGMPRLDINDVVMGLANEA